MSFQKGDKFNSSATFQFINSKTKEPETLKLSDYKSFVLVGFPAAFSPPCSEQHIPAYIGHLKEFAAKGVKVILISKDNLFALSTFAKQLNVSDKQDDLIIASDISLNFTKSVGLSTTALAGILGEVSDRFAVLVKDGTVEYFGKEKEATDVDLSSAEKVLSYL